MSGSTRVRADGVSPLLSESPQRPALAVVALARLSLPDCLKRTVSGRSATPSVVPRTEGCPIMKVLSLQ